MQRLTHTAIGGKPKDRNDDWATPADLVRLIEHYLFEDKQFDLDACADATNAKCMDFFDKETDGLAQDWATEYRRVWCNPPYSQVAAWMEKAYCQSLKGCTVACLVPASTETKWHQTAKARILSAARSLHCNVNGMGWFFTNSERGGVWESSKRINFEHPDGSKRNGNTKGSTLFVFWGVEKE